MSPGLEPKAGLDLAVLEVWGLRPYLVVYPQVVLPQRLADPLEVLLVAGLEGHQEVPVDGVVQADIVRVHKPDRLAVVAADLALMPCLSRILVRISQNYREELNAIGTRLVMIGINALSPCLPLVVMDVC